MFQLKPISRESIPEALEKAERYRLLNEPRLAESICLDILEADPKNSKAIVIMILAISDQFSTSITGVSNAKEMLSRLHDEYERNYYAGIISERQGKSALGKSMRDGGLFAYESLHEAMNHFEKAEAIRPPGNDDSILRWNTCARLIMRHNLQPRNEQYVEPELE